MLKRPYLIALGLIMVLLLIIWTLPPKAMAGLKLAIGNLFVPLQGVQGTGHEVSNKAGDALTPKSDLLKDLDQLRKENQQLKVRELQAKEMERENARLRQAVGWTQQKKWELKLGRVILREPSNWWRTVRIDLGSREGIAADMPVLTVQGLVGKVSAVAFTHSQVVLLGDSHCKVSGLIQSDARDRVSGIVGPSGTLDSTLVALSLLPPNANVKPGQAVVTSGSGGIFPPGIPVGTIVDSHSADYGLSTEARVKLAANLNALEEVWVIVKQ
jgi:rod shape-determining protein MreC